MSMHRVRIEACKKVFYHLMESWARNEPSPSGSRWKAFEDYIEARDPDAKNVAWVEINLSANTLWK